MAELAQSDYAEIIGNIPSIWYKGAGKKECITSGELSHDDWDVKKPTVNSKEITKNLLKNKICENCLHDCALASSHKRSPAGTCRDWRKRSWWILPSGAVGPLAAEIGNASTRQKYEQERNNQKSTQEQNL